MSKDAMTPTSTSDFAVATIWSEANLEVFRDLNAACVDQIYLDASSDRNRNYAMGSRNIQFYAPVAIALHSRWNRQQSIIALYVGFLGNQLGQLDRRARTCCNYRYSVERQIRFAFGEPSRKRHQG